MEPGAALKMPAFEQRDHEFRPVLSKRWPAADGIEFIEKFTEMDLRVDFRDAAVDRQ
jgi:hypothetical protein